MAKYPSYRQGKRMERFENDLTACILRKENNKFDYLVLEKTEANLLEEYKQYCIDNQINGYNYFTDIIE